MTTLENRMVLLIKKLRSDFNAKCVKAEFEAEATRLDEVMRLKEIVASANMDLVIKIGGAEAIKDMFDAQLLGVAGLVAPMIESQYALKKYLEAIEKFFPKELKNNIKFGINIETISAYSNLSEIFATGGIKRLSTITVGRVDLSLSLGLSREDINTDQIYEITENICKTAKAKGFQTTLGGGIAIEAIPFLKKLAKRNIIDRFETRKIVFEVTDSFHKVARGISLANEFELLWLQNKKDYYNAIYVEDDARIAMLKNRLVIAKKFLKNKK